MATTPVPLDHVLTNAMNAMRGAIDGYFDPLVIWGLRLLSGVVYLGFGYAVILAMVGRDWFRMLLSFMYAVIRIAIVKVAMVHIWDWGGAFPAMGLIIGSSISGVAPDTFGPSRVYNLGLDIIRLMFQYRRLGMWFNLVGDLQFLLIIIGTLLIWFGIGCVYLWTVLECDWIVVYGTVTVCFAAFDHTFETLENWFVQLLQVGIKLLATLVIVGIGWSLSYTWINDLTTLGPAMNANQVVYGSIQLTEAILLFYAIWVFPSKAARIIRSRGSSGADLSNDAAAGLYEAGVALHAPGTVGRYTVEVMRPRR